jgi:hypothetical protein
VTSRNPCYLSATLTRAYWRGLPSTLLLLITTILAVGRSFKTTGQKDKENSHNNTGDRQGYMPAQQC